VIREDYSDRKLFLGNGVEAAEQRQALIGDERHDVALAFDRRSDFS
jgi:hypothetical protein